MGTKRSHEEETCCPWQPLRWFSTCTLWMLLLLLLLLLRLLRLRLLLRLLNKKKKTPTA